MTGAFELKLTKEKSLPFNAVQPHQVTALLNTKRNHIVYKIPDESFSQKPYDCYKMVQEQAWVVVMFYARGQKEFFMIDIEVWLAEQGISKRKSITSEDAKRIGMKCELA